MQFLAARSRCTTLLLDKNSIPTCTTAQTNIIVQKYGEEILPKRELLLKATAHKSIVCGQIDGTVQVKRTVFAGNSPHCNEMAHLYLAATPGVPDSAKRDIAQ